MTSDNKHLARRLGIFTASMIVVSAMIGSGVFKQIAPMSAELGSSNAVIFCWIAAGTITLFGALSNAEVAGRIAKPGGQYVYFKRMYGKPFAFLYGWASFAVIQTATSASVAFVFAESVNEIYPLSAQPFPDQLSPYLPDGHLSVKMVAIACIVLITAINILGVRYGGIISNVFASAILVSLGLLVFAGFFITPSQSVQAVVVTPVTPTGSLNISTFFTAMLAAFWAFEGWNTVGFLGGEVKNPKKAIPFALAFGVLLVLLNYVLVNASFFQVLNVGYFQAIHQTNLEGGALIPALEVMRVVLGKPGVWILSLLIICATFNTSNNTIMTSPRIYYAMAKDQLWWSRFSHIHPTCQTPYVALLFHGFVSILFVLSGSFEQLTEMLIFSAFIFYGAGAWGVFVLRKKNTGSATSFKVPFAIPLIFVLFSAGLVINSLVVNLYGSLWGLLLVLAGIPFYFYFMYLRKKKLNNRVKTPQSAP
jgi:basic amino acid/polyamine antiporter, APA family